MTTYSVTSTYSGNLDSSSYYCINNGEHIALSFPITVNEGDKLFCLFYGRKIPQPNVTMGGNAVSVVADDPSTWVFTIQSVTGDIVVSD